MQKQSIFARLFRPSAKGLADPGAELFALFGLTETASGVMVTAETALKVPAVSSAIRLISEAVATLPRRVVRVGGDGKETVAENRHRIRFGNYVASVMSILCEHALDLGWIKANPVRGVRHMKVPAEKQRPHLPWPDDAVAKFRAEARPLPRLIFELGLGSVQRPADWCAFRWADYDGAALRVVQGKTAVALTLPCTDDLRAALDAARPDPADPAKAILRKPDGNPMSYYALAAIMLAERKRLGLEAFDLHALRYRGVMELAWAGCTDDEIAAFSGHASKAMIRKYAGAARQVMQARAAMAKRQNGYGTKQDPDTGNDTP